MHSATYAVAMVLCLSCCSSHWYIVSKRSNRSSWLLLLAHLMDQYCFARCRLSSSVTLPAGRARGRSGGRHCTAGQYGYVPLGRHLVGTVLQGDLGISKNTAASFRLNFVSFLLFSSHDVVEF